MDPSSPLLLTRLPEDALVTVFQYLPPMTHSLLCCVCRDWYRYSSYTDTCATLLSRRVRYWIEWMSAQPAALQTLEHLLSVHPILSSTQANQHLELVELNSDTHPTAIARSAVSATAAAAVGSSSAAAAASSSSSSPPTRRVTIQTAQLLNLVEILCSAFRGRSVRSTAESHLSPLGSPLVQSLESFALESLDLSGLRCVDNPLLRALSRLPALHTLRLADCRMITDAGVRAILHPAEGMRSLTSLDLRENTQLKGAWFGLNEDDDAAASDASPALSSSRPSLLRVLHLRGCTSLVGRHVDFSPRTLSSLEFLDASRTSPSFVLLLVQHLHLCSSLRRLNLSHNRWSASPQLSYLLRVGRFMPETQSTIKALNDSIAALISRGDPIDAPFPPSPTARIEDELELEGLDPLLGLTEMNLSHIPTLPDCVLSYLSLLCRPGVLRELDLSGCDSLSGSAMTLVCARVGAGLRRWIISGLVMTDGAWAQLLQQSTSGRGLPMLQLQEWIMDGLTISGSGAGSAAVMWNAIATAAPNLQVIDVSRLQVQPTLVAAEAEGGAAADMQHPVAAAEPAAESVAALAARLARETLAARTAAEWNAVQSREAHEARERIRNHARTMGLPLPDEGSEADDESAAAASSSSPSPAAAAPASPVADAVPASSVSPIAADGLFAEPFVSALLHRLLHLRVLRARHNPLLIRDAELASWSRAFSSAAETSNIQEIDLSGCEHLSTSAVTELLQALRPELAHSSSSSSVSSSSASPLLLVRVDDCPGVDASAIPLPWRLRVQQAEPFSL